MPTEPARRTTQEGSNDKRVRGIVGRGTGALDPRRKVIRSGGVGRFKVSRISVSVRAIAITAAMCAVLAWALVSFMQSGEPDDFRRPDGETTPSAAAPRRAEVEDMTQDGHQVQPEEPPITYIVVDKVTQEPLGDVILESESGEYGPTDKAGVVYIPSSEGRSGWSVRLGGRYGGRTVPVDLPLAEGQGSPRTVVVAAKCRIAITFLTLDDEPIKRVSVVVAPESIDELLSPSLHIKDGMRMLLRRSPSMTHDWLYRNGLADGRSGVISASAEQTVFVDVNHPGAYNLAASSDSRSGSGSVDAYAGESSTIEVHLERTTEVSGMVVDGDGRPLPGADIRIVCSKKFRDGEVLPQRPNGLSGLIRRDNDTGETFMSVQRAMQTDSSGCFAWPFDFTDGILIWAFYRNEREQFSGCGRFVAPQGIPRDPSNVIITVTSGIPFGATVEIDGKPIDQDKIISFHFTDMGLAGAHQRNNINLAVVLRENRLLIDMLPMGQECRIVSRMGSADFEAVPNRLVVLE